MPTKPVFNGGVIGRVKGLTFEQGCNAIINLGMADIAGIMDGLLQFEKNKAKPNQTILTNLETLAKTYLSAKGEINFQSVVAQNGVEFTPVVKQY